MSDHLPPKKNPVELLEAETANLREKRVNTVQGLTVSDYLAREEVSLTLSDYLARVKEDLLLKSIRPPNRMERIVFGITNRLFDPYGLNRIGVDKGPLDGKSLMQLTDWVPSAAVRKRQKKLIADEIAEINEFCVEGRMGLARWRCVWLTLHWTQYLLGAPFAAAVRLFRKTSAG